MSYTIKTLTEYVVATYKNYEKTGTVPWDYKIAATDLSYQIGSLTKLLMQLHGQRFASGMTEEQIRVKVADELADILTNTLFVAHDMQIDIEDAFDDMLASDEKKIAERSNS